MEFGTRIKAIRESKGITSSYVAEKLGLSPMGYWQIEHNKVRLKADHAVRISEILNVDVKEIFFGNKLGETHSRKKKAR
jgi:transcriptional regulator with XRE-family HTH domain